jgi:hypothetical protein
MAIKTMQTHLESLYLKLEDNFLLLFMRNLGSVLASYFKNMAPYHNRQRLQVLHPK